MEQQSKYMDVLSKINSGEMHLSFSALKAFAKSPASFMNYKLRTVEETDAMVFGSMFHCAVLEPDEFESRYACIREKIDKRTKIGKAAWAEFVDANQGKKVVRKDDYDKALAMADKLYKNRASRYVLDSIFETERFVEWEYKGYKLKGAIDGIGSLVMDLKTCADASIDKFQRDIYNLMYYVQAPMYLNAIGQDLPYYIVAVDKSLEVSVHLLDDDMLDKGFKRFDTLIDRFTECMIYNAFGQSQDFHALNDKGIHIAELPSYAR